MKQLARFVTVCAIVLALPAIAKASSISVYAAFPTQLYQNTSNSPCVFYGPGNCNNDPSGWPAPASPTNGAFEALTQTYTGTDLTTWNGVIGPTFVLGLDINEASDPQILSGFTIDFYNALSTLVASYTLPSAIPVPFLQNGLGYADYVLAAGCVGTTSGSGIQTCSGYDPFVAPAGTTKIVMTFSYGTSGNDGPDKVFGLSTLAPDECGPGGCLPIGIVTPEPASLVLLGTGLVGVAARLRRRKAAR